MSLRRTGEWRPSVCNTRLGDIYEDKGKQYLVIKCRRCSHAAKKDIFHHIELAPGLLRFAAKLHRTDKP